MVVDTSSVASYRPAAPPATLGRGAPPASPVPNPAATPETVAQVIERVATQLGVDPIAAEADAYHESGMNPVSKGDSQNGNPTSFGLYQLHEGGELDNLPGDRAQQIQEAFDPETNARQALGEVAAVRKSEPNVSWGQVFADAERPQYRAPYADAINSLIAQAASGKAPWKTAGAISADDLQNGTAISTDNSATSQANDVEEAAYVQRFQAQDASWSLNPFNDVGQAIGDVFGPVVSKSSDAVVKVFGPLFAPVSEAFTIIRNMLHVLEWIVIPTNFLRVIIFIVGLFVLAYGAHTTLMA